MASFFFFSVVPHPVSMPVTQALLFITMLYFGPRIYNLLDIFVNIISKAPSVISFLFVRHVKTVPPFCVRNYKDVCL